MINYNSNKNIKTNIAHFIADIILNVFNNTFYEISKFNKQLSNFHQILYTSQFYLETQTSDFMIDALEYYASQENIENLSNINEEEQERIKNKIEDDNEEFEAMDMGDETGEDYDAEGIFDLYTNYDIGYKQYNDNKYESREMELFL